MKPSEVRDKTDEELAALEKQLRDQLVKLAVVKATQRMRNTAQIGRLKKDIARIKTVQTERAAKAAGAAKEATT
jgi:large subunit ribosomal protein L29